MSEKQPGRPSGSKGGSTDPTRAQLAKAASHPLRLQIIAKLAGGQRGSPNELAKELDQSLNLVAYHVRVLEKYDCIELVDTKQRRGATEHFYTSTGRLRPELTAEHRALLVQLVDDFADQNGFSPKQRAELDDARRILAADS